MLVVTSELTIAAVTLPGLGRDLGVSAAATAWVLLAYALPMAAIAIPIGRWVDGADVRATFLLAMIGVGLASVLSALAPTFWILLVARVLQGMFAGLVVAVYMPLVLASVRVEQRGRAFGAIVTIMTLGGMAGVPLGGLVAGAFSWREVFVMKIPLLLIVAWIAIRTLRRDPDKGLPLPRLTLVQEAVLLGGAITTLLLSVDQVDGRPVIAGGLAVIALALTTAWTRMPSARPVLTLVRQRTFTVALVALLCMSLTMGLIVFLLPYLIADVLAGTPELTGVVLLFFVGAMAPISPFAGMLSDRYGTMLVARVGGAVMVAAMVTMVTVGPDAGLADLAWRLAVLGVGAALFNTPVNAAILAATPAGMAGTGGGLAMTARTIATTVGPAVAALCWTLAGGGIAGFRTGVVVLAVVAAGGLVVLCARQRPDPTGADPQTVDVDSSSVS
jgi:predicted MFS family arabinose efflux permease